MYARCLIVSGIGPPTSSQRVESQTARQVQTPPGLDHLQLWGWKVSTVLCLPVCLSACLPACLSVCLCPAVFFSVSDLFLCDAPSKLGYHPFISAAVLCLPVCLSAYLPVCLPVFLSLSVSVLLSFSLFLIFLSATL